MVLFSSILSYLVHSVLFSPLWFYWVHCHLIRSYLALFGRFGSFSPVWSYLVHFVHFGPIRSFSLHFNLIPLRSYSVHFCAIWSTLVLFSVLRSYSVYSIHFGPIRPYFVHFGRIGPNRSILVYFNPFRPLWSIPSTLVHFGLFLCTNIMRKYRFELIAPILNLNLLKTYVKISNS